MMKWGWPAPEIRVVNKIPEDGTLVPKHVGAGTKYEVGFMMFYCILISVLSYLVRSQPQIINV